MSWTDEEIDVLFQEAARAQSFEYDNAYFAEIEAALPVNKKGKDFLWMGTALLFLVVLTTGYFVNDTQEIGMNERNDQLAQSESSGAKEVNSSNSTSQSNSNVIDAESKAAVNNSGDVSLENVFTTSYGYEGPSNASLTKNKKHSAVSKSLPSEASSQIVNGANEYDTELDRANKVMTVHNSQEVTQVDAEVMASLDVKAPTEINQNLDQSIRISSFPVLGELRPKSAFYLELNAGMSQSLITPSDYSSTSYGGGVGLESYLGNFSLNTGVNFKLSNHDDLEMTRSWKQYSFGSTSGTENYNYRTIYSLELPITLGYNVGRHTMSLGVRPSAVIGAKITHQSFVDEEMTRSEDILGLAGGLKRFGLKPTIGYSYRMNKWTIGANIGVQLMQSVNEEYINGFNNFFPIDGQIYLRRTIRFKK